jgi:hypothetical protein
MTEPDEALLRAREIVAVEYESFADPVSAEWVRRGSYDRGVVIVAARVAYRAGQAASAERIKALEEEIARLKTPPLYPPPTSSTEPWSLAHD